MSDIEFAEVQNDSDLFYLEVWKNGEHRSFLVDDVLELQSALAAANGRLDRCREALAEAAMPYEALLLDRDSKIRIAPELWKMIEHFAQKARAALQETE